MIVIPAIDIIDNKPVRLYQGDYGKKEIVGCDVLEIAREFQKQGATYLHLVDLDGAMYGSLINKDTIINVAKELNIPVEVGGGIRSFNDAKYLIDNGISRVIIGTIAIENKELMGSLIKEYREKIAVGIDIKDGYVCTKGWIEKSKTHYLDFIKELELMGVSNIIVTDITKDGTLEGTNVSIIEEIKAITNIKVTASGGVKDIDDIKKLKKIDVYGVIVGKAIYSDSINLKEAIKFCKAGETYAYKKNNTVSRC